MTFVLYTSQPNTLHLCPTHLPSPTLAPTLWTLARFWPIS
jgi:hypothetical protein